MENKEFICNKSIKCNHGSCYHKRRHKPLLDGEACGRTEHWNCLSNCIPMKQFTKIEIKCGNCVRGECDSQMMLFYNTNKNCKYFISQEDKKNQK